MVRVTGVSIEKEILNIKMHQELPFIIITQLVNVKKFLV